MIHLPRGTAALALCIALTAGGCAMPNQASLDAQGDLRNGAAREAVLGNTAQARMWVDRATASDPNDAVLYAGTDDVQNEPEQTIAGVFEAVGDTPSVQYYMRKGARQFPTNIRIYSVLVDADDTLGDTADRTLDAAALVKLIQNKLATPGATVGELNKELAQAYWNSGDQATATQKFEQLMALNQKDWDSFNTLAYDRAVVNDKANLPQALVDADKALVLVKAASDPDDLSVGAVQDTLAWVQYRLGDYTDAEQNEEAALSTMPREPESHYHLAMIYLALGREDDAQMEINRALTINPNYGEAVAAAKALNKAGQTASLAPAAPGTPPARTKVQ